MEYKNGNVPPVFEAFIIPFGKLHVELIAVADTPGPAVFAKIIDEEKAEQLFTSFILTE